MTGIIYSVATTKNKKNDYKNINSVLIYLHANIMAHRPIIK
jgi:hypothetical protein